MGTTTSERLTAANRWAQTSRGALILVAVATLVALGLRLWHLDTEPLHVDEIRQVTQVQDTWGRVIQHSYGTQQPPLDYLVGKAVVSVLPATDFVQRLPAALFGTGTVWLLGWVLIRAGQPLAAVFAAWFVAISPLHVELSQYARPYALPVFMVVATIAAYQRWHTGKRGWRSIAVFGLIAALALMSRASMPMLALAVLGLVGLLRALPERTWRRPMEILRADPLALLVLPLLFLAVWVPNALKITTGTGNLSGCFTCDKWSKAAQAVENFGVFGERALRPTSLAWVLVASVVVLLWPRARRSLAHTAVVWAPLLLTAPLFTLLHAVVLPADELFAHRFMVFLPVGLAAYLAVALVAILTGMTATGRTRQAVTALVALVLLVTAVDMLSAVRTQAQTLDLADWRSTADHIESIEQPGEVIVSIDTRPFTRESKFGFQAAPRYYDGALRYVSPSRTIDHPEWAIDATRYHFVLFVPKMADGWEVPAGWAHQEFSEMRILSTPPLPDHEARMDAWWTLTSLLRSDVAVHARIAAAALEAYAGTDLYPWSEVALTDAAAIGQQAYATELLEAVTGG